MAANTSQIINDTTTASDFNSTTSSTTINEQEQIMRISLISNGTNPEHETQNKTDLTDNISQITTTLSTEDSSTTSSTTINDQEQIIISVISNSTNPIKVENRTSENEVLNLNITANTSQIISDTTTTKDFNSTTSSTTINDQEQIMRISNVTVNTSQIATTTEEETTTTTSEDNSSTSQSNSDNEDSSEEEEDEEELDDDESPPGFGNNTDFAATLTSTSAAPINLTDDTILYTNSSESSSVPVIDWRSKFNNTTTDGKRQMALFRRKNLKVLLEYLKSKDINRLVNDIEMSERYRKVAAALKNTIGLLQTLSIDYKDDK